MMQINIMLWFVHTVNGVSMMPSKVPARSTVVSALGVLPAPQLANFDIWGSGAGIRCRHVMRTASVSILVS